jgi:hypothetical protein
MGGCEWCCQGHGNRTHLGQTPCDPRADVISGFQPAPHQPAQPHGDEQRRLWKAGSPKLGIEPCRPREQDSRKACDPVDGACKGRDGHELSLQLRRGGTAPGVEQRCSSKEDRERDGLSIVEPGRGLLAGEIQKTGR